MDRVKEVFMDTEENIKRLESRADTQCEMVRHEAERQDRILQNLAELQRMTNSEGSKSENYATPPQKEAMPDRARNATRYPITYRIARYIMEDRLRDDPWIL